MHQDEEELGEKTLSTKRNRKKENVSTCRRAWRERLEKKNNRTQRIAKLQETHVALELTKLPWLHSSLLASWS
jgi:hypothetical protein